MYKINNDNLKKEKSFYSMFFWVGFSLWLIFTIVCFDEISGINFLGTKSSGNPVFGLIVSWLITGFCMHLGFKGVKEVKQKKKRYEYLAQNGRLEKGLPYRLEPTGSTSNGVRIMRIVVDYELPTGSQVTLYGDGRYDYKLADHDGLVDILIDPNDSNNYYIDFEIETIY